MLLLADPIILLTPASQSDASKWTNFFDYLVDCNDLIDTGTHEITLSELCQDALYSSDRYPEHLQQLQGWLSKAGVEEFDAKTLLNLIHAIAHRGPGLTEKLGITFNYDDDSPTSIWIESESGGLILLEQEGITVHPAIVLSRLDTHGDLSLAFHLTGGLLAYAISYNSVPLLNANDVAILTVAEPQTDDPLAQIEINAVLYEDGNETRQIRLEALVSPRSLKSIEIETASVLNYWPDINCMFHYVCALTNPVQLAPFYFANTFLPSLEAMHLSDKPEELVSIFSRIRDLLTIRQVSDDPFAVLSPPVPDDKNHHLLKDHIWLKDRDWGAWRYHIAGKEFRLHYWWRSSDKYFVLSRVVGHHNDMYIDLNSLDKESLNKKPS